MTSRLPRWAVLLFLPLVAGSLLLMHGLEAGASDGAGHGTTETAHSHQGEAEAHPGRADHSTGGCRGCLAHVVTTCAAVIVAVTAWQFRRRRFAPRVATDRVAGGRARPHSDLRRARDPVWVQLSVMTC